MQDRVAAYFYYCTLVTCELLEDISKFAEFILSSVNRGGEESRKERSRGEIPVKQNVLIRNS